MRKIDTYELAKELRKLEIRNLKEAVKNYGGCVVFRDPDNKECEEADVKERACVMVNSENVGPCDVYINAICVDEEDKLRIRGEYKDDFGEYDINAEDIAVGYIGFITELIPYKPKMKKLWLRLGIEIDATDDEIDNILKYPKSCGKLDLREIINDGRFILWGLTVIQEESIEDFNTEHGTSYEVKDVEYDF